MPWRRWRGKVWAGCRPHCRPSLPNSGLQNETSRSASSFPPLGGARWRKTTQRCFYLTRIHACSGNDVMHCLRAGDAILALVAERRQVEARKQVLAGAEQKRRHGQVHFINQAGLQVLANGSGTAEEANVQATCCGLCTLQRRVDPLRDEVEDIPAFHLQRRPLVMRENENGRVIGWILSPPAAPGLVGPRSADGAEHVATHYPRPDSCHAPSRKVLVDAGVPALAALHALEGAGVDQPVMQVFAAD